MSAVAATQAITPDETTWVEHLAVAQRMAERLCVRKGVYGAEAEDFISWVQVRLIENDYAILRKFRGESCLSTFLCAVVANAFRDHRDKLWGKWRASAAARRLGPVAMALEVSVYRDRLSLTAAVEQLAIAGICKLSLRDAAEIIRHVPERLRRVHEGQEALVEIPGGSCPEEELMRQDRERSRGTVLEWLDEALSELHAEDRRLLHLRYNEGLSVADVARTLGVDQKPLYRRLDKILAQLRNAPALAAVNPSDLWE